MAERAYCQTVGRTIDFEELTQLLARGLHRIDVADFQRRFRLAEDWSWETVAQLVAEGKYSFAQLHLGIHLGT